jgi:hypothetical protein
VKQRRPTSTIIFLGGPRPHNSGTRLLPPTHRQRCNRRSRPEMRSSAGLIVMEEDTRHFTIRLTIARGLPLTFCTRLDSCRPRTLRTSFGNMGRTVQDTGSRFTRLADTSFWSSPASVSIRDGEMAETVHTGPVTVAQPTDMYCDIHRDCEWIWWRSRDPVPALT